MRILLIHPTYQGRCDLMRTYKDTWQEVCDSQRNYNLAEERCFVELQCDTGHTWHELTLQLATQPHWIMACSSVCCVSEVVTNRAQYVAYRDLPPREIRYLKSRLEHNPIIIEM